VGTAGGGCEVWRAAGPCVVWCSRKTHCGPITYCLITVNVTYLFHCEWPTYIYYWLVDKIRCNDVADELANYSGAGVAAWRGRAGGVGLAGAVALDNGVMVA